MTEWPDRPKRTADRIMETPTAAGWTVKTLNYALELEEKGLIDRDCPSCQSYFIPRIKAGARLSDIFAPNHKASDRCRSGKHPHCTCDTCF